MVREGVFYGWPYSYYGQNVDVRMTPPRPDLVQSALVPDYALGAHTGSLGLTCNTGVLFPAGYHNDAFIGQRGSWNREPLSGYKVILVQFINGLPSGDPRDVLTGFVTADGGAMGRPVGVAIDATGALLVADDVGNMVWRVAPANAGILSANPRGKRSGAANGDRMSHGHPIRHSAFYQPPHISQCSTVSFIRPRPTTRRATKLARARNKSCDAVVTQERCSAAAAIVAKACPHIFAAAGMPPGLHIGSAHYPAYNGFVAIRVGSPRARGEAWQCRRISFTAMPIRSRPTIVKLHLENGYFS